MYCFTGYLAASLFLHEDHELIVLLINTLQKVCVETLHIFYGYAGFKENILYYTSKGLCGDFAYLLCISKVQGKHCNPNVSNKFKQHNFWHGFKHELTSYLSDFMAYFCVK